MPLPDVRWMPSLAMAEGPDHERLVAEILGADADDRLESLILERLDPQYDVTAADRAVLWDDRVIDRVHTALTRIAARISQRGAAAPQGIAYRDLRELRGRIAAERKPMGSVIKQLRDQVTRETASLNRIAHRVVGRIHHQDLTRARAMLKNGKTEAQVLASLRDRTGLVPAPPELTDAED